MKAILHSAMRLPCKHEDLSSIPRDTLDTMLLDTMLLDTMLLDTVLLDTMSPAHLQSRGGGGKAETVGEWSTLASLPSWLMRPMEDLVKTEKGMLAKWLNR